MGAAWTCIILGAISILTRILPLGIADWLGRQSWVARLAAVLPCMILTLLLVSDIANRFAGLPGVVSMAATLLCHMVFRQTLLSLFVGCSCYALVAG